MVADGPADGRLGGWRPSVSNSVSTVSADPFGAADHVAVQRGLAEFRSGRPIVTVPRGLRDRHAGHGMGDEKTSRIPSICGPAEHHGCSSRQAGRALSDTTPTGPIGLATRHAPTPRQIASLVTEAGRGVHGVGLSSMLAPMRPQRSSWPSWRSSCRRCWCLKWPPTLAIGENAVARRRRMPSCVSDKAAVGSLAVAAEADIPLNGATSTRFVISATPSAAVRRR